MGSGIRVITPTPAREIGYRDLLFFLLSAYKQMLTQTHTLHNTEKTNAQVCVRAAQICARS